MLFFNRRHFNMCSMIFKHNINKILKYLWRGTASIGTAPAGVTASGIADNGTGRTNVGTDPYELNKLNAGKPGFTKDREMIMGHKFKYFRKGDKKGQVYSR